MARVARTKTEPQRERKSDVTMRAYLAASGNLPDKLAWSHRTFTLSEARSLFVLHAPLQNVISGTPCCGQSSLFKDRSGHCRRVRHTLESRRTIALIENRENDGKKVEN